MRSLGMCGEVFDNWADVIEADVDFNYNVEMVGITLEDGWIIPIVVILN